MQLYIIDKRIFLISVILFAFSKKRLYCNTESNAVIEAKSSQRNGRIFFGLLTPFVNIFNDKGDDDNDTSGNKPDTAVNKCSCDCGIPNSELRIVGGHPTAVNRYPWIARLVYKKHFLCGASLISKKYVITAAHCVNNKNVKDINVILGDHDQTTTSDAPAKLRKILMVIKHRNFDSNTFNNDIAVLKLRKPIQFSKNIQPVCLPPKGLDPAGYTGTILGWGRSSEGGMITDQVQEAQVPILNLTQCRSLKYRASMISKNMVCAGGGRRDACQGDSGGPLLVQRERSYELVGITSWGLGCGRVGYPGVYTRIDRYINWIELNLETKVDCLCEG